MKRSISITLVIVMALASIVSATTVRDLVGKYSGRVSTFLPAIEGRMLSNGNVFFVNSAATNARDAADEEHGNTWEQPFATISYAVSKCTASKGDVILVAPTHTETISTAALGTIGTAGVWVIGIGIGGQRPTLSLSAAASVIYLDGDSTLFQNFNLVNTATAVTNTTMMKVSGQHCVIKDISFSQGGTAYDANGTTLITVGVADGDSNDLLVDNCFAYTPTAGGSEAVKMAKDQRNVLIRNCDFVGDFSTSTVDIPTVGNAQVNFRMRNCVLGNLNSGEPCFQANGTGNTGAVEDCTLLNDSTAPDMGGINLIRPYPMTWGSDSDSVYWNILTIADNGITAAKMATDSITSDELAATALDEIADKVWENEANSLLLWSERGSAKTDCVPDSEDLFLVAGGPIMITSFVCLVTETVDTNAATVKFFVDRDDGATDTDFTTAVNVETDVLGTLWIMSNANPAVLTPLTPGSTGTTSLMMPWYCPPGMIQSAFSAANLDGGYSIYMRWKPLVAGTTVTAQ